MPLIGRLFLLAMLAASFSCQDDLYKESVSPNSSGVIGNSSDIDGLISLGKQLENPYATEVMQQAAANIGTRIDVKTSHLYVKFIPKNEEELYQLEKDSTLTLFSYPLDYEIEEGGTYYRDPTVPEGQPTYQYTVVEIDYHFPKSVEYEILEELYQPENASNGRLEEAVVDELEDEAYRITGNLEEEKPSENSKTTIFRSRWRPAGRITFNDDVLGVVPMQGVEVRARKFTTFYKGITDANGRYSCDGRFRDRANYSIQWERNQFKITSSWAVASPALYNGPKMRGDWNLQLNRGGRSYYYANVFRAALHYYYQNINGLRRPPQNGFLKSRMTIGAYFEENDDANGVHGSWWYRRLLELDRIRIYNPQNDSDDIYATTIHELAHASHWGMGSGDFNDTDPIVKESWASGVQWELSRMIYAGYTRDYSRLDYTGVVQDMIDGPKVTTSFFHSRFGVRRTRSYNDNVSGYTIRQIEDALNGQETWDSWRINIVNRYTNGTEGNLPATFTYWNSI